MKPFPLMAEQKKYGSIARFVEMNLKLDITKLG